MILATGRRRRPTSPGSSTRLARSYFRMGDYPKAAAWAARYFKDGGTDPQMRVLRVKALYIAEDYATAAAELRTMIDADEKAGVPPPLEQLQLLASCYIKLNDNAGYVFALEKLLIHYPKKEYWADAIRRVETRPGFAEALAARRAPAAGGHRQSEHRGAVHGDGAARAEGGLSRRSQAHRRSGIRLRCARHGPDAELQRRLRDTAAKQVAEDERMLVAERQGRGRREGRYAARQRRLRDGERRPVRQGSGADGAGSRRRGSAAGRRRPGCISRSPISPPARRRRPSRCSSPSRAATGRPISRASG